MTQPEPVWVIDTSSIAEIRRALRNDQKREVFKKFTELVAAGRLVYPAQVAAELERWADPENPDQQYKWAHDNRSMATRLAPTWEEVQDVLAVVPQILDPNKDSGSEEADPYVLAQARSLVRSGRDARVVTEEKKNPPGKMSLSTAAGILGIPCVPLRGLLHAEDIVAFGQ